MYVYVSTRERRVHFSAFQLEQLDPTLSHPQDLFVLLRRFHHNGHKMEANDTTYLLSILHGITITDSFADQVIEKRRMYSSLSDDLRKNLTICSC
jgi:hypothetical protein